MALQFQRTLQSIALCSLVLLSLFTVVPAHAQKANAVELYNQGIDAYGQGNTAKAMGLFEKAVAIDPNYADAFYNLGSIYYQRGLFDKAEKNFRRVMVLSPNDGQAKYNLALALEKQGRSADAMAVYQQIPASDAKYAQARKKMDALTTAMSASMNTAQNTYQNSTPQSNASSYAAPYSNPPASPTKPAVFDAAAPKKSPKPFSKGYGGPTGMAIGPDGYLFVADYTKNIIYKVGANGEKTIFAQGEPFGGPIGLTYNPKADELYVANYMKNNVVRISPKGQTAVLASGLSKPYNIYLDTYNNVLYVSEQGSFTVSRIDLQ